MVRAHCAQPTPYVLRVERQLCGPAMAAERTPPASHQPVLTWVVNQWSTLEPRLDELAKKSDPKNDVILFDLRKKRGEPVSETDASVVMAGAQRVDLTGIRQALSAHPYLFNRGWGKQVSVAAKEAAKKAGGKAGCYCLIAYGDSAEHAPEGLDPMPDFCMNVMPYFHRDLKLIAEHNLRQHQAANRVATT